MDVTTVRVFADGRLGGNPCPVILAADGLETHQMQSLTRQLGSESVYVLSPTDPRCDLRLRYFVPNHEMEMCVHATVAALTILDQRSRLSRRTVRVQTVLGVVEAAIGDEGEITVEQFPPTMGELLTQQTERIAATLGCRPSLIGERPDVPRSVSVSRPKLLVELTDRDGLDSLAPDADEVRGICADLGVTGLYPFVVRDGTSVDARQFPANSGYLEDAATGVAAAALGALLASRETARATYSYAIHQGEAMGRPSRITTHATVADESVTRTAVSGRARP